MTETMLEERLGLAWDAVEHHRAQQDPGELRQLVTLATERELEVSRLLEIGIRFGGSLWLWRHLWPAAYFFAIDLIEPPCEGCDHRRAHSGCPRLQLGETETNLVLGDSTIAETRDRLLERVADSPMVEDRPYPPLTFDFVHIDGDHDPGPVRADWQLYGELVRPGGFVVFHDAEHCPGVRSLFEEIAAAGEHETFLYVGTDGGQGTGVVVIS